MPKDRLETKPVPIPTAVSAPYWAAASEHRLTLQFCHECEEFLFYPRALCGRCNTDHLEWREVPGSGTVYSYSTVQRAPTALFREDVPYVVCMIDLDEGVRMMSSIVGDTQDLKIGAMVKVEFEPRGPVHIPVFRLVKGAESSDSDPGTFRVL